MRKWTSPQSRCILCTFQVARSSCVAQPSFRSNFSTTTTAKQRTRGPDDQKVAPRSLRDGETNEFPSNPRIRYRLRDFQIDLEGIKKELEYIQKRLSQSGYDCHGPLWDEFCDELGHVVTGDPRKLTESQTILKTGLSKAYAEGAAINYIQSLFLDRYLENKGHNVSEALSHVADLRYPTEWFTKARSTQREIHLHIGPTNSGKTYNALKRLEEAGSGFYAGPLRLLAHEVYSRFRAKGLACDLVTGDDVRLDETVEDGAKLKASTVEMVEVHSNVEVAVIDEIQMMADPQRGWAWTRAFMGACAKEVHLCGENRVLPLVQELVASMGDNLHIHEYQRLNELRCMNSSLHGDLKQLRPGDAVICFSIVGIHAMKKAIETRTGRRCAIVYGSLPPETRAQQAALFNDPSNQYDFLVASDAIGMGLNLSIKRVIFETVHKFDGLNKVQLSVSAIKQIAGRAGRFRTARDASKGEANLNKRRPSEKSIGMVTTLMPDDLRVVRAALATEAEPITTAGIMPPGEFVEDFAARLPANTPHEYVLQRLSEAASVHPRFALSDLRDQSMIARVIDPVRGLTTAERHIFTAAPFAFRGLNKIAGHRLAVELAECLGQKKTTSIVELQNLPLELLEQPLQENRDFLNQLEFLHQGLILYMWLSYRMNNCFQGQAMAFHAKTMVEERINLYLEKFTSADGRARVRKSRTEPKTGMRFVADARAPGFAGTRRVVLADLSGEPPSLHTGVGEILDPLPTIHPGRHDPALPIGWDRQPSSGQDGQAIHEGDHHPPEKVAGNG